jgi:hypothetical protein
MAERAILQLSLSWAFGFVFEFNDLQNHQGCRCSGGFELLSPSFELFSEKSVDVSV